MTTYINSGNLFFNSDDNPDDIKDKMSSLFREHYPFVTNFALLSQNDYQLDKENLPIWWIEEFARKDVLFYSDKVNKKLLQDKIEQMPLTSHE